MAKYRFEQIAINSTEKKKPVEEDRFTYLGLEHLDSGSLKVTRFGSDVAPIGEKLVMRKGDVLFGKRRAYQKKVAIAPFDGIFSAHGMVLRPNVEVIDPDFFPLFISSDYFLDAAIKISVGSLSPTINWRDLKILEFELPNLETQRKLAAVLWSINDTMESYKKLISATDELVKSQFIEMFGDIHTNPLGWDVVKFGDICEILNGYAFKSKLYVDAGIRVIRITNVQKGYIEDTDPQFYPISYGDELSRYTLQAGDILLSLTGNIGRTGLLPESMLPAALNQRVACIRMKPKNFVSKMFLYSMINSDFFEADCIASSQGIAQKNMSTEWLKDYPVIVPPETLQEKYVTFVRQSDKSKLLVTKSMSSSYYGRLLSNHLNHNKGGIEVETRRKTFAAYLEDEYYDLMFNRLKTYVYQNKGRLNLHTSLVPNPSYIALDDIHVMGVTFKETEDDRILFRAAVQTDIVVKGRTHRDYEEDMSSAWFAVSFTGILRGGLTMVTITSVEDYTKECFNKEDALTKFLVPYVYAKDLDLHAEKFLKKYCPRALETPMPLPIKEVLETMCLTVYPAPLPDGIFGRTYFNSATVDIYKDRNSDEIISAEIEEGTILVSPDSFFMRNIGCTHNTIIHECVHWDKHYKFFELQKLINPELTSISCKVVEQYKKGNDELSNELEWMEWQASAIAPKILIPAHTGRMKLNEILISLTHAFPNTRRAEIMQLAIGEFADFFQVSTMAAKIRAIELGFEQAAGVFNYVDGHYYPPFSFTKGVLKKDQTFIIDRNNAIFESTFNETLAKEYRAGHFIHAGGMFIINDPKYVHIQEDAEAELTDYALEHIDECCLVFNRETRVSKHYDDSYYRICFLCRDADSKSFVEANFNPREGKNEDVLKRAQEMSTIMAEAKRVSEILADIPSSFCGTLDYHVKRRGYTNEKMEERTGISSRMIQDYRNKRDAKPALPSVLALCIGLNLQPAFSYDLILKAGHNIMIPMEENLVYQYLINNHHMENIHMWNQKLQDAGIAQQLPKNGNKNTAP